MFSVEAATAHITGRGDSPQTPSPTAHCAAHSPYTGYWSKAKYVAAWVFPVTCSQPKCFPLAFHPHKASTGRRVTCHRWVLAASITTNIIIVNFIVDLYKKEPTLKRCSWKLVSSVLSIWEITMSRRRTSNNRASPQHSDHIVSDSMHLPAVGGGSAEMDLVCSPYKPQLIARDGSSGPKTSDPMQSYRYDSSRTDSGFESIRSEKCVSSDSGVYLISTSGDLSYGWEKDSDRVVDSGTCDGVLIEEDEDVTDGLNKLNLLDSIPRTNLPIQYEQVSKCNVDMTHSFLPDEDGDTVVHLAIIHMVVDLVFYLINIVPDISYLNQANRLSQTPLHLSVITKQPKLVRRFVLAGVYLEARDRRGNTSLHLACERSDLECAKELLRHITQDETKYLKTNYLSPLDLDIRNFEGKTCMHLAVLNHQIEMVELLLSHGADFNPQEGTSGRTPLHFAVELQDLAMTKYLVSHGVDVNAKNYAGYSPLQYAYNGNRDIVSCLLAYGAEDIGLPLSSDSESDNSSSDEITKMDSDDVEFSVSTTPQTPQTPQGCRLTNDIGAVY